MSKADHNFSPNLPEHPAKAYRNLDFLNSDSARSIRVQCELTEPRVRFREEGVQRTVVFFGSARTPSPEMVNDEHHPRALHYYESARKLSHLLTKWAIEQQDNGQYMHVCSGGGPGIMEAANRGASEAGGKNIGLGISLPFEQFNNKYITPELSFEFHYFFVRKFWFLLMAEALVIFPGGFGTFDEMFECLTLIQTKKTLRKIPVVLFGSEFWKEIVNFDALVKWGVISPGDLNLFKFIDDVDEARDFLVAHMTQTGL